MLIDFGIILILCRLEHELKKDANVSLNYPISVKIFRLGSLHV